MLSHSHASADLNCNRLHESNRYWKLCWCGWVTILNPAMQTASKLRGNLSLVLPIDIYAIFLRFTSIQGYTSAPL